MRSQALISATMLVTLGFGWNISVHAETSSQQLARAAVSENVSESAKAIALLRSQGQQGIKIFLDTYGDKLQQRQSQALDAICQQRDCYASRLYWYTDLQQAKAAAKATGKPILSLRLLGRLDEDLSCANSRFFRTALYPNGEVSQVLRDRFILHWQSVRPVPKVTIDFGDGRKMQSTITGNSIHYILDAEGRPIDALPGLYGPGAFLQELSKSEQAVKEYTKKTGVEREDFLTKWHSDRLTEIQANWVTDLSKLGISSPPELVKIPNSNDNPPTAQQAAPIAMSKMVVENPLLTAITNAISRNREALTKATGDEGNWTKIAQLHAVTARLDSNSKALMQQKNSNLQTPVIEKFENYMALDTVRNEYQLHSQIHEWFIRGIGTNNIDTLNERVYSQLFLTPSSDPWLGLLPQDAYTAIENDGISK